jgi:hypothetical protein
VKKDDRGPGLTSEYYGSPSYERHVVCVFVCVCVCERERERESVWVCMCVCGARFEVPSGNAENSSALDLD